VIKYNWNINKWVAMCLPFIWRKPNRIGVAIGLLGGIKVLWNDFNAFRGFVYLRVNYNSQQRCLAYLLNILFNTGTQITVKTISDTQSLYYGFGGDIPAGFNLIYGDAIPVRYGSNGQPKLQGEVIAPLSLTGREGEIRAWVDYVIFADKNYKIKFV
jgi:hypothetical protein